MVEQYRRNNQIRAKEVRLIDETGKQIGVVSIKEALALAQEKGLDLVEVAPQARPPVCRIMNYSQWIYQKQKKEKAARKKQKATEMKELKFSLRISDNDLQVKLRQLTRFLNEGHKVKINIRLRGRERAHLERVQYLVDRIYEQIEELAVIEKPLEQAGRFFSVIFAPRKK